MARGARGSTRHRGAGCLEPSVSGRVTYGASPLARGPLDRGAREHRAQHAPPPAASALAGWRMLAPRPAPEPPPSRAWTVNSEAARGWVMDGASRSPAFPAVPVRASDKAEMWVI